MLNQAREEHRAGSYELTEQELLGLRQICARLRGHASRAGGPRPAEDRVLPILRLQPGSVRWGCGLSCRRHAPG